MKNIRAKARGKLNLFLRITGKRPDGYHTLETVFQQVALCDGISLALHNRGGISVRTNKRFLPTDGRNLALRAAEAFFAAAGMDNRGLFINIKKVIPVGGGMAGGSTDAAAVLTLLNRAYGRPLGREALLKLGVSLGADVPFCMVGGAALATGIGEVMRPVASMPPCFLVLCRPAVSVSTKVAFQLADGWTGPSGGPRADRMVAALASGSLAGVCAALHNDFEGPVMARWPQLREVRQFMLDNGALGAMMTGTGSVVFGVFHEEGPARSAAKRLEARYREVAITTPRSAAGLLP